MVSEPLLPLPSLILAVDVCFPHTAAVVSVSFTAAVSFVDFILDCGVIYFDL